jgi:hypothetical protein
MQLSTFRQNVKAELVSFAWEQWSRLGLFAPSGRDDRRVADPEALLLLSFEAGRDDPRLFDEVLDWLLVNERSISVQRLRNLSADDDDRRLVEAAIGWLAHWQPRGRFAARGSGAQAGAPEPLFRGLTREVRDPDPAFLAVGFVKPDAEPGRKSRQPDPLRPVALAFRLRLLFGVGSRAEVVRFLLTNPSHDHSVQVVAEAAGFAKRNVAETLTALAAAGLATTFGRGNERRYALDRPRWGELLGFEAGRWPEFRDWPRLLRVARVLRRRLEDPRLDELSPYMLASEARRFMTELEPELARLGLDRGERPPQGEEYWGWFVARVEQALASLRPEQAAG